MTKQTNQKTFNFYGIRKTTNPNYYSVSLCAGKGDSREWINVPVKKELVIFSAKGKGYLLKLNLLEKQAENQEDDLPF